MSVAFDMPAMLAAAARETGLSDWGEPPFRDNLQLLLASLDETGHLNPAGRAALQQRLHATLCNRLRLFDDRKKFTAIAQQSIVRPIIVIGMGRTGSSNLLDLLSRDPANRVPRLWEIMLPSPPPRRATCDTDPRIAVVQQALDAQGFDDPELRDAHPFSAQLPEECGAIFEFMFASGNYSAFANAQRYQRWHWHAADFAPVYRFHHQFLQHLQSQCGGERWALKSPESILHPQAMIERYPDAIFIHTHRDPVKVVPSLTSLIRSLRRVFADPASVDGHALAREQIEWNVLGLERTWQARQHPAVRDRFYDMHFQDLIARPLATIEKLYAHFDLEFSAEARRAMAHYVAAEAGARHGHGRHHYSMAEFGLAASLIEDAFKPYMQRYGIETERRQ